MAVQEPLVTKTDKTFRDSLSSVDDKGERMFVLQKERPGSPLKIDPAMAGVLSWWARLAAIASGATSEKDPSVYEERGVRRL